MAVRIASSTASSPPPPVPSDRAARLARRSTSAAASAANAAPSRARAPFFTARPDRGLLSRRRERPGLADRLVDLAHLPHQFPEPLYTRRPRA